MLRTLRNLLALAFFVTMVALPGSAVQAQGDYCASVRYRCNGMNVDFAGCVQSCGELWQRCSDYCAPGSVFDFYCDDSGASRSGYCDCQEPCFEG